MKTLKYLAAPALLAVVATGMAAPASAAVYSNANELRAQIGQLDRQIDRARVDHRIDGREAARLEGQVRNLNRTWSAYARGGFNSGERRSLENQISRVRYDLQHAAHWDARQDRRDRDDHRR